MIYTPIITKIDAKGLLRSKKKGISILGTQKFVVHYILVGGVKKVALCDVNNELLHIITRKMYQEFITPEIDFGL